MSWRKTLIVGLILCCLAAFYYLFEVKFLGARQEAQNKAKKVFTLKKEDVQGIRFIQEGKKYELGREKEAWVINDPIKARGDQQAIEQFLAAILAAEREREIGEIKETELKAFGLFPPRVEVAVQAKGAEQTVLVGEQNPVQTGLYAMGKGDTRVFLLSLSDWEKIDRDVYALRDKTILTLDPEKIKGIEVRYGDHKLRVQKEAKEWRMTFPLAVKADKGAINGLVDELNNARVARFVDEAPRDLRPYGLLIPRAEVWVEDEKGKQGIRFGGVVGQKGGVYAQLAGGNTIVEVDKALFALVPTEVAAWRDKDIFAFDNDTVIKWSIRYMGKELVGEKKDSGRWELIAPQRLTADTTKVTNLLWDIQAVKAAAFVSPYGGGEMAYGFHPAQATIEVWFRGEQKPSTLIVGRTTSGKGDRVYVMKQGDKEVYQVLRTSLKVLDASPKDLQYRKLISFSKDSVREIEVITPEKKAVFVKKGDQWKAKPTGDETEPWKIAVFLMRLEDVEYEDELTGAGKQTLRGLDPPRYQVILRFNKKDEEISLSLGNEVPQQKERIYAMLAATRKTYVIGKDVLDIVKQHLLEP